MNNQRILADNYYVSNNDFSTKLNNNDLIVGGSGSGKTTGYVIPNIINSDENMIITDTKGQLYKEYGNTLKCKGYQVFCLDFVNPSLSVRYNPLEYISKVGMTYSDQDISTIANAMNHTKLDKDPFWTESAKQVIGFLISYVLEAFPESQHSMTEVGYAFLNLRSQEGRESIIEWINEHKDSISYKRFCSFYNVIASEKTWESIMQFVSIDIMNFMNNDLDTIFGLHGKSKIDFNYLCSNRKIAYFVNVSDTDRACDNLIQLFYTQALQVLCKKALNYPNGRLVRPVRLYLDDFASNVTIKDFDKLISIIRSRNISVSVMIQSLSQLDSMYGVYKAKTIVTNCDHIVYLGGQDYDTAKYIGLRCDKQPETIMYMPLDKSYVIERGKKGILVEKTTPLHIHKKNFNPYVGTDLEYDFEKFLKDIYVDPSMMYPTDDDTPF